MNPRELAKRIERGEKWRPSSRDIEQFSPKNVGLLYGVKRGFIRRVIYDNWLEISIGLSMFAAFCYALILWVDSLPDPVM